MHGFKLDMPVLLVSSRLFPACFYLKYIVMFSRKLSKSIVQRRKISTIAYFCLRASFMKKHQIE